MSEPIWPPECRQAVADWRAGAGPRMVACAQGASQFWPVYASPPQRDPRHVGGVCPPHAPLTYVRDCTPGWRCVEQGQLGADDGPSSGTALLVVGLAAMLWWIAT